MREEGYDLHYLRHVAALSGKREVVAHTSIFSRTGIKLVDAGTRIGHHLYDKLIQHKLLPPIDDALTVADAVTPASLQRAAEDLFAEVPAFAAMMPGADERHRLALLFATLPLAPPLAFKLTVAREERSDVFRHSMAVACCAAILAYRSHMAHHEVVDAAAAGLFHDLGLLHIDPRLLDSRHALAEAEHRHLYSHPLTAHLILARMPEWHPRVSAAVLEHHERLDGSGYPRGLAADKLGLLGQLLAVAEVAVSVLERGGGQPADLRLAVVLRMNAGKLNREYTGRLLEALMPETAADAARHPLGDVLAMQVDLSIAFLSWDAVRNANPVLPLVAFIDRRMERLGRSLADVGVDLKYWTTIDAEFEFDASSLGEIDTAAREGIWQLRSIAQEARRRWDELHRGSEAAAAAVSEWIANVEALSPAW